MRHSTTAVTAASAATTASQPWGRAMRPRRVRVRRRGSNVRRGSCTCRTVELVGLCARLRLWWSLMLPLRRPLRLLLLLLLLLLFVVVVRWQQVHFQHHAWAARAASGSERLVADLPA